MDDLQYLVQARNLIINKENWIKGASARTAYNEYINPTSDFAAKFCAIGALIRVTGFQGDSQLERLANLLVVKPFDDCRYHYHNQNMLSLSFFNDEHTHEEVIELFDKAILRELEKQDIIVETECAQGALV